MCMSRVSPKQSHDALSTSRNSGCAHPVNCLGALSALRGHRTLRVYSVSTLCAASRRGTCHAFVLAPTDPSFAYTLARLFFAARGADDTSMDGSMASAATAPAVPAPPAPTAPALPFAKGDYRGWILDGFPLTDAQVYLPFRCPLCMTHVGFVPTSISHYTCPVSDEGADLPASRQRAGRKKL